MKTCFLLRCDDPRYEARVEITDDGKVVVIYGDARDERYLFLHDGELWPEFPCEEPRPLVVGQWVDGLMLLETQEQLARMRGKMAAWAAAVPKFEDEPRQWLVMSAWDGVEHDLQVAPLGEQVSDSGQGDSSSSWFATALVVEAATREEVVIAARQRLAAEEGR